MSHYFSLRFSTLLFLSSDLPNSKNISLSNQKNLWLNPFSLHRRISMVAPSNHRVQHTTIFGAIWSGFFLSSGFSLFSPSLKSSVCTDTPPPLAALLIVADILKFFLLHFYRLLQALMSSFQHTYPKAHPRGIGN